MVREALTDNIVTTDFERLFDVNGEENMWYVQYRLTDSFSPQLRSMNKDDINRHLMGTWWIATAARGCTKFNGKSGATTRWVTFYIPGGGRVEREPVEARVALVKRIMAPATPLVFANAGNPGSTVYFRLDRELPVAKMNIPVINKFTRLAVPLTEGFIELLPRNNSIFRLPCGRMQHLQSIGDTQYAVGSSNELMKLLKVEIPKLTPFLDYKLLFPEEIPRVQVAP